MIDSKVYKVIEDLILILFGSYFDSKWLFSIITLMFLNSVLTYRFKKLFGTNLNNIVSEFINNFFILITILFATRIFSEALSFQKMMIGVVTVFVVKEVLTLLLLLRKKTMQESDPEKRKLNNLIFNKIFQMFANAAGLDLKNISDDPFKQNGNNSNLNSEIINNQMKKNEIKNNNSINNIEDDVEDDLRGEGGDD
ncbi:MAG: hypothetical protein B6I28_05925 [Fusobacteriia bacterium 4572_132]|nr:MAG: hypothetical protein B6I28_05925 [Fusobacteriia bacterium 4572_132]